MKQQGTGQTGEPSYREMVPEYNFCWASLKAPADVISCFSLMNSCSLCVPVFLTQMFWLCLNRFLEK